MEYKSANLQWYHLVEGLVDSQDQKLKESLLMHLKLIFKTASKLSGAFTCILISPFVFSAKYIINSLSNQHGVSYNVSVHEWKYLIMNRYMYY